MSKQALCWYDFETWGLDPRTAPVASCALIITDEKLREQERYQHQVRPNTDRLLSPMSAYVSRLNPFMLQKNGIAEWQLAETLFTLLTRSPTTTIGYNNSSFDNQLLRFLFFRSLLPAYAHEQSPNATFDILNLARFVYALRPDGINWPRFHNAPSFRLVHIAQANSITHTAHDALSDVEATLAFARLIRDKKSALFDYCVTRCSLMNIRERTQKCDVIYLYLDKYAGFQNYYITPVVFLPSPFGKNYRLALDLRYDYQAFLDVSDEALNTLWHKRVEEPALTVSAQIRHNVFGTSCPRLFSLNVKKAPIFVPLNAASANDCKRLSLDRRAIEKRHAAIITSDLPARLYTLVKTQRSASVAAQHDLDATLYDGLISHKQQEMLRAILRQLAIGDTVKHAYATLDTRLQALVTQYLYRFYPEQLSSQECIYWRSYIRARDKRIYETWLKEAAHLTSLHKQDVAVNDIVDQIVAYNNARYNTYELNAT